jgi:hypothetical protein
MLVVLVAKRQTLRERDASRTELESNRSSSRVGKSKLSQAPIDRCIRRADSSRIRGTAAQARGTGG